MARTNRGRVKVYAGTDGIPTIEIGGGLPGTPGTDGTNGTDGTDGADGVSVVGASINGGGHLILDMSSGPDIDAGVAKGADGVSITGASINGSGHLILTRSVGGDIDVGDVTGDNGADGRSVTGASIDGSGHLILTFSSAPSPVDLGDVTGSDGTDGTDGTDGVSVVGATVDGSYHLILDMSSGADIDAGYVRGPPGADGLGAGDVIGPAGAVNNRFAVFDGATGKLLKDAGYTAGSFATAGQGTTADAAVIGAGTVTSGNPVVFTSTTGKDVGQVTFTTFKTSLALNNVDNTSDATKWAATKTLTNTTYNAAGTGNVLSNISTSMFASGVLDTDGTLAANSDSKIASQKATKTYVDALIAAADAMVFKGVIDCSANPNYPAADRGWTYRVSVAGKIGGASGVNVEVGDILLCLTDSSASGNQATVGANWSIIQTNLDGAVIGPASSTSAGVAGYADTSGKLLKQLTAGEIRTAAGLATTDNPQFATIELGAATDTTVTRVSAGVIAVEGVQVLTQTAPVANNPTLNNAITVESYAFNTSTNAAVDLANGTDQTPTLTGNWVPNTGWPTPAAGQSFLLTVKSGTGGYTVTWPSSVKWAAGTAPTLTSAASKADIIGFKSDGTSSWLGIVIAQNYTP